MKTKGRLVFAVRPKAIVEEMARRGEKIVLAYQATVYETREEAEGRLKEAGRGVPLYVPGIGIVRLEGHVYEVVATKGYSLLDGTGEARLKGKEELLVELPKEKG